MRESPERLLRRIRLGKDGATGCREVAFSGGKIAEPDRDELADELAAFANARLEGWFRRRAPRCAPEGGLTAGNAYMNMDA